MAENQNYQVLELVPLTNITADGNSVGVDISAYEGIAKLVRFYRDNAGSTPTIAQKCQCSSDDGSVDTYADVTGGGFTTRAGVDGMDSIDIDLDQCEKYLRVNNVKTGTANYDIGIVLIAKKKYV